MNPGIHGATAAAAAAERKRRLLEEEEERMTRYNQDELDSDWEFKIVRSTIPVFRKPEVLQRVLDEEAIAGWKLLEKLDDNRIRLKRPATAHRRDTMLPQGVDPYRTQIGNPATGIAALIVGLTLLLIFGALVMLLGFREGSFAIEGGIIIAGLVVGIGVMTAVVAVARSRM